MDTAILLSGGIESTALAYLLRPRYAITCDYGQKPAQGEIDASSQIALLLGIEHHIIRIDCKSLGSGDLVGSMPISGAPSTEWWPYRNQLLTTFAAMHAIRYGVKKLVLGSIKQDGFHVDGTCEFYERLNLLVSLQESSIQVEAPAIQMTSIEPDTEKRCAERYPRLVPFVSYE